MYIYKIIVSHGLNSGMYRYVVADKMEEALILFKEAYGNSECVQIHECQYIGAAFAIQYKNVPKDVDEEVMCLV